MARSPSRHRPKLEPITISELEADPTMVGFTSLFRIPTTEMPLSHLLPPGVLPPDALTPAVETPDVGTPNIQSPDVLNGDFLIAESGPTAPTVGLDSLPPVNIASGPPLTPAVGLAPAPTVGSDLAPPPPQFPATPPLPLQQVDSPPRLGPDGAPANRQAADSRETAQEDAAAGCIVREPSAPTVGLEATPAVLTIPEPSFRADPAPTVGPASQPTLARAARPRPTGTAGPASTPTAGPEITPTDPAATTTWQTEAGEIFTGKRARRIQRAQDALTHAEETVYDALWGSRATGADRERFIRIGYDRLAALARVNEKSARLIIPRLVEKGFLEIHAPADPNRRLGTEYRVFSYGAVLEHQRRRGRQWVLRSGNGVFYVRPVASLTAVIAPPVPEGDDSAPTVGFELAIQHHTSAPTVGAAPTVTGGPRPTDTVGAGPTDTVGAAPTVSLDNGLDKHRQSPSSLVYLALSRYAVADDDAVKALIGRCRTQAPDATEEEIAACIAEKGKVIVSGRIDNPIAFLLVYVPKCFAGEWLREYRQSRWALAQGELEREREAREWDARERARLTALLGDPEASAEDREWARQYLGLSS